MSKRFCPLCVDSEHRTVDHVWDLYTDNHTEVEASVIYATTQVFDIANESVAVECVARQPNATISDADNRVPPPHHMFVFRRWRFLGLLPVLMAMFHVCVARTRRRCSGDFPIGAVSVATLCGVAAQQLAILRMCPKHYVQVIMATILMPPGVVPC